MAAQRELVGQRVEAGLLAARFWPNLVSFALKRLGNGVAGLLQTLAACDGISAVSRTLTVLSPLNPREWSRKIQCSYTRALIMSTG